MMQNKLPKDWEIKTLGDILKISSGNGLTKSERNDEGEYLVYGGNGITGKHNEYIFEEEKLIIGRVGAHCGNAYITKPKSWVTDNAFVVSFNDTEVNKKFLLNLIGVLNLNKYSVSTAQPVISQRTIYPIEIILPPLETQQAIVSKIEELFSELDKGIEDLKTAQLQLKTYRQSVLKWAFEGKLTNENVKDGELPKGWEIVKIKDVALTYGGYAFKSGEFKSEGKYQVLRMGNVRPGIVRYEENPVFLDEVDESVLKRSLLKIGDVIITQTGTRQKRDYGFTTQILKDNLLLNQRIASIRFDGTYLSKFFLYYSWTDLFKDQFFANETGNVGQGNVGMKAVTETLIPNPSIKEQELIIQEIESRLSVADKMEESIAHSLLQAESLRQSILIKAFNGELV